MKILAYVHAYVPRQNGGGETTLHDLMRALHDAGHETLVVVRQSPYLPPMEYVHEGVRVVVSEDKNTIARYIGGHDLVISHLDCSERASLLAQRFNIPVAFLIHNNLDLTKGYISSAGVNFLIFNTEWIKEDFAPRFGNIPSIVVHPPIDSNRYRTEKGKKVTLVNLFERKGTDVFYELAKRMPDVEFLGVIGGYGPQDVRELPNVEIMEHTPDIKDVYSKTKVILMPSKYESYGRVACEALASGIPSIVAPTDGLREALDYAGTYVDRDDLDGWEKALRSILTPRRYGAVSKLALKRSADLDALARRELDDFVLYCEQYVTIYKNTR